MCLVIHLSPTDYIHMNNSEYVLVYTQDVCLIVM